MASFPADDHVIHERTKVVIQFCKMRFSGARYDSSQIHVFWQVTDGKWQIQACARDDAARCTGATNVQTLDVEEVYVQ